MSTRSVIAKTSDKGKTFKGVYHHWDGYPLGLGSTLIGLHDKSGHFEGRLSDMLEYLIDKCPQGWSTINGANFFLPPAPKPDSNLEICKVCGNPNWSHYKQYYEEGGFSPYWKDAGKPPLPQYLVGGKVLGHSFEGQDLDCKVSAPNCFSPDDAWEVTQENASGSGCEWCYAFDAEEKVMYILSSYCGEGKYEGEKMIGAFGQGDPNGVWKVVAEFDLKKITTENYVEAIKEMELS